MEPRSERPKASDFTVSYETTQEYQPKMVPPVHPDNPVLAVMEEGEGGDCLLFTAGPNGELIRWSPDPTSFSGWQKSAWTLPEAPSSTIARLMPFRQRGRVYVLVVFRTGTWWERVRFYELRDTGPQPVPVPPEVRELLDSSVQVRVLRDRSGEHWIFGQRQGSPERDFFVVSQAGGGWAVNARERVEGPSQSFFGLLSGDAAGRLTLIRIEEDANDQNRFYLRDGALTNGTLRWGEERRIYVGMGTIRPVNVYEMPGDPYRDELLLHESNGNVFHLKWFRQHPAVERWTGGSDRLPAGVNHLLVSRDAAGRTVVFGVSAGAHRLWVRRQSGFDPNGFRRFGDWQLLGDDVRAVGTPAVLGTVEEMVQVSADLHLRHLSADAVERVWQTRVLETPRPSQSEVEEIVSHSLQLTAVDARGLPVPGVPFDLAATGAQVVFVNGRNVRLEPGRWVRFPAGATGRLTVKTPALELGAVKLEVHVPDFMRTGEKRTVSFDAALHARMSGADPRFPVTGPVLKESGVLPKALSAEDTAKAVELVKGLGRQLVLAQADCVNVDQELLAAVGDDEPIAFTFDFTAPEAPALTVLRGDDALAFEVTAAHPDAALFTHDTEGLGQLLGDFLRKAGNFIRDVVKVTVKIVQGAMDLAVEFLNRAWDKVFQGINAGVRAIAAAVSLALEKLKQDFNETMDAVRRLIDLLKVVFDWRSILVTKQVFDELVVQFLGNLETSLRRDGVALVRSMSAKARARIREELERARGEIGGSSLDQLATRNGTNPIQDRSVQQQLGRHGSRCNFVMGLVESYGAEAFAGLEAEGGAEADELRRFLEKIGELFSQERFRELDARFRPRLERLIQGGFNPALMFSSGLNVILDVLQEIAETAGQLVEETLVLLLEVLATAIQAFRRFLEAPLPAIPVLTPLYARLAREAGLTETVLRSLDLLTLTLAVPCTVLYRVLWGGADLKPPFTQADLETIRRERLPLGDLQRLFLGPRTEAALSAAEPVVSVPGRWCAVVAGLFLIPVDIAGDSMAIDPVPGPPLGFIESTGRLVLHLLGFPYAETAKPVAERTFYDHALITDWSLGTIPPVVGLLTLAATGRGMRTIPVAGPLALTFMGAVRLISGAVVIVAAAVGGGGMARLLGGIRTAVASLPVVCKFCIPLVQLGRPKTEPFRLVLFAVDGVAGLGAAGLAVAQLLVGKEADLEGMAPVWPALSPLAPAAHLDGTV